MRSTELVNARLTKVTAGGKTDTYDEPGTEGGAKWEGDVGVWFEELRERRSTTATSGDVASDVLVRRDLTVQRDGGPDWQEGDVVTFQRSSGGAPLKGTVQLVDFPEPPPGEGGEVRLTLELG